MTIAFSELTSRIIPSALAVGTLALAANPAHAEWSFQIEPYLLGVTIDGDAGVGRATGLDIDISTSDILDNLDLGGMVHFEAHHDSGWGIIADYAFMELSDDLAGPRGGVLSGEVFQGVFEAMLIKGTGSADEGLDLLAGLRWWNNEIDVTIDPVLLPGTASASLDEEWLDVVVGARWRNPIGEKWLFSLRGDVGAGGADFTWQVVTGFRYKFGNSTALDLGYRALGVDYESGVSGTPGYFKYDTTTHGPAIGFVFNF